MISYMFNDSNNMVGIKRFGFVVDFFFFDEKEVLIFYFNVVIFFLGRVLF